MMIKCLCYDQLLLIVKNILYMLQFIFDCLLLYIITLHYYYSHSSVYQQTGLWHKFYFENFTKLFDVKSILVKLYYSVSVWDPGYGLLSADSSPRLCRFSSLSPGIPLLMETPSVKSWKFEYKGLVKLDLWKIRKNR